MAAQAVALLQEGMVDLMSERATVSEPICSDDVDECAHCGDEATEMVSVRRLVGAGQFDERSALLCISCATQAQGAVGIVTRRRIA